MCFLLWQNDFIDMTVFKIFRWRAYVDYLGGPIIRLTGTTKMNRSARQGYLKKKKKT